MRRGITPMAAQVSMAALCVAVAFAIGWMVAHRGDSPGGDPSSINRRPLSVGVFCAEEIASADITKLCELIQTDGFLTCREITARDLCDPSVSLDVIVVPGGSATRYIEQLGNDGRDCLCKRVLEGTGYVGICAGAYLALSDSDSGIGLLNSVSISTQGEMEGWGSVSTKGRRAGYVGVDMSALGKRLFGHRGGTIPLQFRGGPIVDEARSSHETMVMARYSTEVWSFEFQRGTMRGTPAIFGGKHGRGCVIGDADA